MGGAWQPDPWGRFGFRWATELGWTEHVSNGTSVGIDPPGPRAAAPAPAPAAAPAPAPAGMSAPAPVVHRAAPAFAERPVSQRAPAVPADGRHRRWGLVAVAMVLSFGLGALVFGGDGGGGDDESSEFVTAVDSSTPEVASAGPVPPTAAPTTIVETTVPPTVPETVPETVPPTEPPAMLGLPSRNDLQIDDLEWLAITDMLVQQFAMEVPPKEVVTALGVRTCEAARASATLPEWEVAVVPIVVESGLAAGQFGMLMGAAGVMMCSDDWERLLGDQLPTF